MFASSWNRVSLMRDAALSSPSVEIWSDASGGWGCGAWWSCNWFQVCWEDWLAFGRASIAAKELLSITVAIAIWDQQWVGSSVLCHCDNEGVVTAVKGGYCKDPTLAHMSRCLFFLEAKFNMLLLAKHVLGVENGAADSISRNNMPLFFNLLPQAHREPDQVPKGLVHHLMINSPWISRDWRVWLETLSMTH